MTSTRHTHGRKTFVAITATIAKTPADQFPPPWGRPGVGAANIPHQRQTPFTYTGALNVYVANCQTKCNALSKCTS